MESKEGLIYIYNSVIQDIKNGYYVNPNGEEIEFEEIRKIRNKTKFYETTPRIENPKKFKNTKIYVQNIDSYLKAIQLGPDCAVLNMASRNNPGGGVSKGSRAQEEELCRRSNLLYSLYSYISKGKTLFDFENKESYPIPTYGGIYSPGISIYRKPDTYGTYEEPFLTNVISVSGVLHPTYDPVTRFMQKSFARMTKEKIRTIFRIALLNKHSKLVLGALGCGAFGNPPEHVALIFKEVLEEPEFKNSFEEICFAILDDGNTGKEHNPNGNYKPFVEVFGL